MAYDPQQITPSEQDQPPAPEQFFQALGEVACLLSQSSLHQDRPLRDLAALALPALQRGQIRIWRGQFGPVGFATWGWLDAATEEAVLHHDYFPQDDEWANGPRPVIIDFVAPMGGGFRMARDLSRTIFPDRAVRSVRRAANGAARIIQLPGLDETGHRISARATAA